jgi:hypothetical protein
MLRITIELVPGGLESGARVIGQGWIANTSNLSDLSNYASKFEERSWQGRTRGPYVGTLTKWPRKQRGAWEIVSAALKVVTPTIATSKQSNPCKRKAKV